MDPDLDAPWWRMGRQSHYALVVCRRVFVLVYTVQQLRAVVHTVSQWWY